jgi:hypothetical protein
LFGVGVGDAKGTAGASARNIEYKISEEAFKKYLIKEHKFNEQKANEEFVKFQKYLI